MNSLLSIFRRSIFLCVPFLMYAAAAPAQIRQPDDLAASAAKGSQADQVRVMLIADRETVLSSAAAAKIKHLNATIGMSFGSGHSLVVFECDEPEARLKMAKAELTGAQETLEARVRMQGLQQASDVEVALAAAAVNKARGQIDLYQSQIAQCTVSAPWAGRVAKVHVKNFMTVAAGQPLVDLVKSGPLRVKLNLPSRLITKVAKNARLNVSIDETGKTYEASVTGINSRVDSVSQTVEVEAMIAGSYPELLPGMSGVAKLAAVR